MFRLARVALRGPVTGRDVLASLKVLGFDGPAPKDAIRKQYLDLTKKYHPDVNDGNDDKMALINQAYEVVQEHHHLLERHDRHPEGGAPGATKSGSGSGAPFQRARSNVKAVDEDEWFAKSEFDWSAAVGDVSDADIKNEHYQPFALNKFFSFDDDVTVFRMIRDGATVRQVARALGQRPVAIERRLANSQFKLRIQYVLRKDRNAPRNQREKTAAEQAVYREPLLKRAQMTMEQRAAAMDLGFDRGDIQRHNEGAWSAENVVSKIGRSYSHFARFNKARPR